MRSKDQAVPYYKITLTGGERSERYEFATQFGLRAADRTGHQVVFHKEHPADPIVLRKSYQSAAGKSFEVQILPITSEEFHD